MTRPRGNEPAARAALRALDSIAGRYEAHVLRNLDDLMEQVPASAREGQWRDRKSKGNWVESRPKFQVELARVQPGTELSFVDELRAVYLDVALSDTAAIGEIVNSRHQQLHASPNWRLHPAAGIPEAVPDPFTIRNHSAYLKLLGLDRAVANEAAGITVAVLDNGFDSSFWQGAPSPTPVAAGQDLIFGDASTSGHGTLVAALIASSAPGADVVPFRMAGQESTEWDALHALACAVQLGAQVVTFSYRQILAVDNPCQLCGLVRTAARSEVFAKMIDWASNGGKRAILAAAGNDGIGSVARPAAYKGAIPVAALDSAGTALWSGSNWDAANHLTVLAAPGEDVASGTGGFRYSGTSFATAYAAALYAVAMGRNQTNDAMRISKMLTPSSPMTVSNATVPVLN